MTAGCRSGRVCEARRKGLRPRRASQSLDPTYTPQFSPGMRMTRSGRGGRGHSRPGGGAPMVLFAAGGEALWGPIDFTPVVLAGWVAAGAVLTPVVAVVARLAGRRWGVAWRWGGAVGLACAGVAAGWCLTWLL